MLKIGITGGIGSGKTVVCRVFETLGIPVYYADLEAKRIMNYDVELREQLNELFQQKVYNDEGIDRKKLASLIFNDATLRLKMEAIVHPAVIRAGSAWMDVQQSPYLLKEAAILFESGSFKQLDKIIGVFTAEHIRIERVMKRDGITAEEVRARMQHQMPEEEKMKLCDYILDNTGDKSLLIQIHQLHTHLLQLAMQSH